MTGWLLAIGCGGSEDRLIPPDGDVIATLSLHLDNEPDSALLDLLGAPAPAGFTDEALDRCHPPGDGSSGVWGWGGLPRGSEAWLWMDEEVAPMDPADRPSTLFSADLEARPHRVGVGWTPEPVDPVWNQPQLPAFDAAELIELPSPLTVDRPDRNEAVRGDLEVRWSDRTDGIVFVTVVHGDEVLLFCTVRDDGRFDIDSGDLAGLTGDVTVRLSRQDRVFVEVEPEELLEVALYDAASVDVSLE